MSRVLFATDLHGSERTFRKFVNAVSIYKADVAIIGGDLTGKLMVAVKKSSDGTFSADYIGDKVIMKNEAELKSFFDRLGDSGHYPVVLSDSEIAELDAGQDNVDKVFSKLMEERLKSWIHILERTFSRSSVKIFMTGGNDDQYYVDGIIRSSSFVSNPEGEVVLIDDKHEMISTGYSNKTPWKCPRDLTEEELGSKFAMMVQGVKDFRNCVFNFHVPPIETLLDECVALDESVFPPKPLPDQMTHAGSTSVREIIEKYQPLVTLHGHIHESRGADKLGRTLCLNPGSEYSEGILRSVILNLGDGKIKSYQFLSG